MFFISLFACHDHAPSTDAQRIEELTQQVESLRRSVATLHAQSAQNALADLEMSLDQDGMARELDACEDRLEALEWLAPLGEYVTVSPAEDAIVFHGANVYIQSGEGRTDVTNGLGNLVLGYGEDHEGELERSGSHNLVIGMDNAYTSYGGVVVGDWDALSEPYAVSY